MFIVIKKTNFISLIFLRHYMSIFYFQNDIGKISVNVEAQNFGDIMKFKRKIYNNLLEWKKNRSGKTALLIEGARRVGKSFVVAEFAKQEYKNHVIIDFSIPRPLTLDAILNALCKSLVAPTSISPKTKEKRSLFNAKTNRAKGYVYSLFKNY